MTNFQRRQMEEGSEMMREERTRQLNKVVADDWNYQVEFKRRQEARQRQEERVEAREDLLANTGDLEREADVLRKKEVYWQDAKR